MQQKPFELRSDWEKGYVVIENVRQEQPIGLNICIMNQRRMNPIWIVRCILANNGDY